MSDETPVVTDVALAVEGSGAAVENTPGNTGIPAENGQEEYSLDDLMNADFGEDAVMNGTHKGLPSYGEILKHLPENGRKLIQNLRQSYTEKTQNIAELRRQVEAERAEIGRQKSLMSESEFARGVAEKAAKPLEHDAWSEEGLEERIEQRAAKLMASMLAPLQEDIAAQARQSALNAFKEEHPDLTSPEMRVPIARLLVDRPELKLADAYYIVKGQTVRLAVDAKRATAAETLQKTSTGNAVRAGEAPKFKSAWDAYNYHKSNGMK